jgi:gentisate 1,2-dioxygenase
MMLADIERELERRHLEGHWRLTGATQEAPAPFAAPYVWRWAEVRRLLTAVGEVREIEGGASRRTIRLCTPGYAAKWTTPTIHASIQLVKPGEVAQAHRHSIGAFRFVLEGSGGYTTVDGQKVRMEPGDMILTPHGSWHDHGHEGNEAMMWIDGHDFPLVSRLNALFFENYPQRQQPVVRESNGLPFVFKGRDALATLQALGAEAHDPRFGTVLEYLDRTSGSMLPTIGCRLQRLDAGETTERFRQTPNVIYHAVRGAGATVAGDVRLDWTPGDIFVMPGWTSHRHETSGGAILLAITDEPVYAAFGLLRREACA